ncbi:flagellar basal body rod protein FlgC [Plastorhodobacter daqingensis]|uniref:Flagellar basal-body rod protein FlgC n=1 Tax=Plastorhodobacter daqingensis TaxID=1387281 RepID=A0ABW2UK27_9RHOB
MTAIQSVFDVASRALSAQQVRLNAVASNLANARSAAGTPEEAYRAIRPVFETEYARQMGAGRGLSTVNVADVVALDREPERVLMPDHPDADPDGYVYRAAVDVDEELVEMVESSRQYQNILEVVSTLRTLMSRTVSMGQ